MYSRKPFIPKTPFEIKRGITEGSTTPRCELLIPILPIQVRMIMVLMEVTLRVVMMLCWVLTEWIEQPFECKYWQKQQGYCLFTTLPSMVMLRIKVRNEKPDHNFNTNLLTLVINIITTDATNDIRMYSLTNTAVSGSVFIMYCFQWVILC